MTTIAFRDGIMACDSCWADRSCQVTSQTKIFRLKSGALWGGAGDADDRAVIALLDNVKTFKQMPSARVLSEICADIVGILALPNGDTYYVDIEKHDGASVWAAQLFPVGRYGYIACGSGRDLALGAMAAGKTAMEAVNIACKFDLNSRPPVHQLVVRKVIK